MKTRKSPHRGVLALAVGAFLFSSSVVTAVPTTPIEDVPQSAFIPVEVERRTPAPTAPVETVPDPSPSEPLASPRTRERVPLRLMPEPPPKVQQKAVAVVDPGPKSPSGSSLSGHATWYCGNGSRCTRGHPGGLYAAIRRDLLYLRGQRVTVVSGSRRVTVTIIDCNCGPNANIIDLYTDAFDDLAPLSRGRIPVTLLIP